MILSRNSRILVSVLDWGLGHASRTSALVRVLKRRGCTVVLAGSGRSLSLLHSDFPECEVVEMPSFSPHLSNSTSQWLTIGLQVPQFLWSILRERMAVDRIVRKKNIHMIISDNRYGFRSSRCPSYILTHQLNVRIESKAPQWMNSLVSRCLLSLIRRFDACLVPDRRLGDLSGRLSSPVPAGLRAHSIGVLSRLADIEETDGGEPIEWLGIVSGPEPQRGIMVSDLQRRFAGTKGRRVIVCGLPERSENKITDAGIELIGYADARLMKGLILVAKNIVCRSGYSTILDLAALGKRAELIPTPGQAEQEYLAELHNTKR